MLERLLAAQEQLKEEITARMSESLREEIKSGQEEMKAQMASLVSKIENYNEKFEVLQDNLVSQIESNQAETEVKLKEMSEEVQSTRSQLEKTQVELQAVEVSLDTRAKKLEEDVENMRADFITNLTMVNLGAKPIDRENLALHHSMEEKIETNKREFQAQLEEVQAIVGKGSRTTGA